VHDAVVILDQEKTLAHEQGSGGLDGIHIIGARRVALLDRRPRIAGGEPLGFGICERDELAELSADVRISPAIFRLDTVSISV